MRCRVSEWGKCTRLHALTRFATWKRCRWIRQNSLASFFGRWSWCWSPLWCCWLFGSTKQRLWSWNCCCCIHLVGWCYDSPCYQDQKACSYCLVCHFSCCWWILRQEGDWIQLNLFIQNKTFDTTAINTWWIGLPQVLDCMWCWDGVKQFTDERPPLFNSYGAAKLLSAVVCWMDKWDGRISVVET